MKKLYLHLTALLLALTAANGAQAQPVGGVTLQSLLEGATITAGDKLFADWRIIDQTIFGENVVTPNYNEILVGALVDGGMDPGPGLEFDFGGQLQATGDDFGYSYIDLFFGFSVEVLDPGKLIKDVSLNLQTYSINNGLGDNGIYVLEQVGETPFSVQDVAMLTDNLANTHAEFSYLDPSFADPLPGGLTDNPSGTANFDPQKKIYVSKNILVWANSPQETATLGSLSQRYSQTTVPEPDMILLMAVGLMGFAFSVKRQSLHGK